MITLLGTGHVFRIEEQITFIIRSIWPKALLVELDAMRYNALRNPVPTGDVKLPWMYRRLAEYQKRMAGEFGGTVGSEMLAAVDAGIGVGAVILFIDNTATDTVKSMWEGMPIKEKVRLMLSFLYGKRSSKDSLESELQAFTDNEQQYMEELRKKFPTLVNVLIDQRNQSMVERIRKANERYDELVVVVGDGHVEGIAELISDLDVKTIRLKSLLDKDRMSTLRKELSPVSPMGAEAEGA